MKIFEEQEIPIDPSKERMPGKNEANICLSAAEEIKRCNIACFKLQMDLGMKQNTW